MGISATQVVQLVAQKLTRVTFPFKSAVVFVLPSSSTKVDSGAACAPLQPDRFANPLSTSALANTMRHTDKIEKFFIGKVLIMLRREFNHASVAALVALLLTTNRPAYALSLSDLTNAEASRGLKAALEKGVLAAVALLGKPDGFLGNPKVRIPLPGYLENASQLLRNFGQGKRIDELVTAINRAADAAVPMGKDLLIGAVRSMNVNDAKNILQGGETSVTSFFVEKTRSPLGAKFLPVVTQATEKVEVARKYNEFASKAVDFGLVKKEDANIQQYITSKTLDGLYLIIAEEERKIRQNPVGTGSAILQKVFGALK